jgi:hypothetical protein
MSTDTQELIRTFEQLPVAKRVEVADFARFLLAQNQGAAPQQQAMERWLGSARGAACTGITTDQVMALTRGEA